MSQWNQVNIQGSQMKSTFGCRVKTDAQHTEVVGPYGDRVKIAVEEPARDGRANQELVRYVADLMQLEPRWVEISSGSSSPDKRISVQGRRPEQVRKLLARYTE